MTRRYCCRGISTLLVLLVADARGQDHGSVAGRVVDPDGTPAAQKEVFAYSVGREPTVTRSVKTHEDGEFRFDALPVGKYVLSLEGRHGLFDQISRELNAEGDENLVTVTAGKTTRHGIRRRGHRTVLLGLTHRGKALTGTAVCLVRLNAKGDADWTIAMGREENVRQTDREGLVEYQRVVDGPYAVVVNTGPWRIACGVVEVKGARSEAMRHDLELGPYEVVVRVVDVRGKPVTEAQPGIASEDAWVGATMQPFKSVMSEDGLYTVPFMPAGRLRAYVNAKGDVHSCSEEFEVGPGTARPIITVEMALTGVVAVRVVTAGGKPAHQAQVSVDRPGETPYYHNRTDEDGVVELTLASAGEWVVRVRSTPGREVEPIRVRVEPYVKTVLTVTAGQ